MTIDYSEHTSELNLSYQFSIEDTSVYLDHTHRLIKIDWDGRINLSTASKVLTYVADVVEGGLVDRVLLDRQKLISFDRAARNWMKKELICGRGIDLRAKTHKVAIINERSVAGRIYSERVTKSDDRSKVILPIRKFDSPNEALKWVMEE